MMSGITARLTCVTYNVHSGIGADGRYDLERIHRVLADARPHVVGLQELNCGKEDQAGALAGGLTLTSSFCRVRPEAEGSFGMAVLAPFRVLQHQQYDLS